MTGHFADRMFRIAFVLAGIYNLAFGLWAGFWPLSFFELFDLASPRYPGIWACLGMVVGVYGLLYLHAAWKLETAWPIIAVGFLGKVLGPIGMAMSFGDDWPRRVGMLCVFNDLIWWLPFGLFLVRGSWFGRWLVRSAPWLCVVAHLAGALAAILFLRHGMITEPDPTTRSRYIAGHGTAWSIGWCIWMLSAVSYVGFCAWWGSYLADDSSARRLSDKQQSTASTKWVSWIAALSVLLAALGMVFDFSCEAALVLLLVEHSDSALPTSNSLANDWDAAGFNMVERCFMLFSAGAANLLYTVAGILLTLATPNLPTWVRASMWATWLAGVGMSIAAWLGSVLGLVVTSIFLFPLLLVWCSWMAARWRRS